MAESLSIGGRLKHAWNAFLDRNSTDETLSNYQPSYGYSSTRQDRIRPRFSAERTIISSIYTRLSVDAASNSIKHVRLDDEDRYIEDVTSYLNYCLKVKTNVDQTARFFRQDIFLTLFDEGVIAIVPVDTTENLLKKGSWDINTMRVGKIVTWYPQYVKVNIYNDLNGKREDIILPKSKVAVVENPFYAVMNEPNSTLQRLSHKLSLLDVIDEQSSSGKLDLIIQLPYVIKTDARRQQAEVRRKDIEMQLKGSQYGIAYTDGTEKITQLNRPVENNLLAQVTYLTTLLYSQLGLTDEILKGTADEATMLSYFNRTIEPLVSAVVDAMNATFLTKTAQAQGQAIKSFRDPFKYVTIKDLAEISDVYARNEIASSNELRQIVGWKPSKDPNADLLRNSNMPQPSSGAPQSTDNSQSTNPDTLGTQ